MPLQSLYPAAIERLAIAELHGPQEGPIVSLESRLIDSYARAFVDSGQDVSAIGQLLRRPDVTDPDVLAQLQELTGQYNVDINLLNVMVRKAVGTAETLLRAS
ncbi:hypothetical protein PHLH5_17230 [Pseudomonas sp. Cab53]|uniref:type III secretion system inner rod subunit SctI n=1 Tax=unclassified Pseudomonas TaxID=196821 RepID=UPI001BB3A96D|nr:type III secretion system inner rod subunit SctI [Pseudomonas sp. Cab53]BBP64182.1 hypothetical protein PHLH5_17230 [Pseudomonas sp. Cab53]